MKNWLIGKLLGFIARKLDGCKTKIGGGSFILMGVTGLIGEMFPDQGLPRPGIETSIGYITGGFTILGVGHKIEKARTEIARTAPVPAVPEETEAPAQEPPVPLEPHRWDGRTPGQFP